MGVNQLEQVTVLKSPLNASDGGGRGMKKGSSNAYLIVLGSFFYETSIIGFVVLIE
jgi:hypothetical protein